MIKTREAVDTYMLAAEIASRMGAAHVGTEHLVYALMTADCMIARVFSEEEILTYEKQLTEMSAEAVHGDFSGERTPMLTPRLSMAR